MAKRRITRKEYEDYLNEMVPQDYVNTDFIIGGKRRKSKYGTALRNHDSIAFEVGFEEWAKTR